MALSQTHLFIIHQRENLGLEALHLVRQQAWKHLGGLFDMLHIVICYKLAPMINSVGRSSYHAIYLRCGVCSQRSALLMQRWCLRIPKTWDDWRGMTKEDGTRLRVWTRRTSWWSRLIPLDWKGFYYTLSIQTPPDRIGLRIPIPSVE